MHIASIPRRRGRLSGCLAAAFALALTLPGCSILGGGNDNPDGGPDVFRGPARALFELPRDGNPPPSGFYALPFPNDIRIDDATGRIDLSDYTRPNSLLENYINTLAEQSSGFSLTAASFVRFDAPIDADTLPATPEASVAEGASVYLVNVDRASPDYGVRVPLRFRFETYAGATIGDNWLSVLPYPGFVLRERTTYALVLSERLSATDGTPVGAPDDFALVMDDSGDSGAGNDPAVTRARALYQPLLDWLDEPGGDERANVVVATVFTTHEVTSLMGDIREVIWNELAMPTARDVVRQDDTGENFMWYDGAYDAPCFQRGVPPFERMEDGGDIVRDPVTGNPVIQRVEPLRFSFTVPRGPTPVGGWPVVLYAHGTGGDYHSFVYSGVASLLAEQGLAMISIDQVMHEPRIPPGSSPELLFFNFQNPLSARDNTLQGAADDFQLLRLALGLDFTDPQPDGAVGARFDPDRVYFFGHSQGGLTGPPFLAHEPLVSGAVLSGAGGLLYMSLTLKTEPVDIAALVASFIRDYPLDEFNPMLGLLQTYIDRADPVVYARLLIDEPPPGITPKYIFQSEGLTDRFTPVPSIEALAVAMGVDLVAPVLTEIEGLRLKGQNVNNAPVTGNRNGVTGVLLQYNQAPGSDGHFVVFDIDDARVQSSRFLGTLAQTGEATLVVP